MGVYRFLRLLHHPDHRQHSWLETVDSAASGGPKFHLSTRWYPEWKSWFYGSQDPEIQHWITHHSKPDWVAFDIGMNFGFFACLLGQRCSAVYGFEPVPWLAKRARANVELNRFSNVAIAEIALSERPGEALLNLPSGEDSNWGTSSLVHQSTGRETLKVPLDTVDNCVDRQKLCRLDFIKIDVEGAEDLVLRGAAKTLRRFRPTIIFEHNPESVANVAALLRQHEYRFADLSGKNLGDDPKTWPHDVLALPLDQCGAAASAIRQSALCAQ
jgi:FkbM family methyltransferase